MTSARGATVTRRLRATAAGLAALTGITVAAVAAGGTGAGAAGSPPRTTTITLQGSSYTPRAPRGATDDYHCTLVDPHVTRNSYIVASHFYPNSVEVHHAILALVPPDLAHQAEADNPGGRGWTCFGQPDLPGNDTIGALTQIPWLAAWAPGVHRIPAPGGTGVQLPAGSLVVMQIHYNLLRGDRPVRARLVLTTVPAGTPLKPLHLLQIFAPPDVPCPAGVTGPLCNRAASLADLGRRFGASEIGTVDLLERICGRDPADPPGGDSTTCTYRLPPGQELLRITAHMHLLGRGMRVVLDPGTSRARVLLDVTNYDFNDQRYYNLAVPVITRPGDTVQMTCTYDPTLRQELPQLRRLPPRYVTWGDGSSDEMCLGLLQMVTAGKRTAPSWSSQAMRGGFPVPLDLSGLGFGRHGHGGAGGFSASTPQGV